MPFANTKGADQPAHPRSMTSAFVIRYLDSIINLLATSEISRSRLVSAAERGNLTLSETTGQFSRDEAHLRCCLARLFVPLTQVFGCNL